MATPRSKGDSDQVVNSHLALKTSDNCVEDLANSLLLAAIFALFSNVLSTTCFAQT